MALGSAELGDRCPSLVVDSWLGELSCGTPGRHVKETVKFAGTRLFVESAPVKRKGHLSEVAHDIHEFGSLTILE